MILNKKQLNQTEKNIQVLKDAILSKQKANISFEDNLQVCIWEDRVTELSKDIIEYLKYKNNSQLCFSKDNLDKSIIALRISSGKTQKELAELIGVKEQQIQRYENQNYLSASFERVIQIYRVLCNNISLFTEVSNTESAYKFRINSLSNTKILDAQQIIIERRAVVNY